MQTNTNEITPTGGAGGNASRFTGRKAKCGGCGKTLIEIRYGNETTWEHENIAGFWTAGRHEKVVIPL